MVERVNGPLPGQLIETLASAASAPDERSAGHFAEFVAGALRQAEAGAAAARAAGSGEDEAQLLEAARAFESLFLQMLLQGMRRTVPEGGLFPKGFAVETYEGMYDQHLSEEMAKAGGIGLAKLIVEQLTASRRRFDAEA